VGETIEIEPLTDAATAEMVGDLLGARPDPGFSDALRRTDNLPLLVQELVQGLRDEKLITVRDRTASLIGPRMPDRFGSSIRERLGHLTAPTLRFVQAAAALGRTFSLPAAAELLDRPTGELIDAVTEAIASDLLVDGATLAFRHDAIREAAESMLTPSLRMHLRRRAADVRLRAGEPVLAVASSLADSAGAGDEPAIRLLTTAALELAETDAVSAGDLASRVVSLINGGDGFESTLTELVPVLWVGGRVDEARLLATRLRGSLDAEAEGRVGLTVARLELESSFVDALRTAERTLAVRGLPATIRSQLLAVKLLCAANVADHRRLAAVLGEARAAAVASADAIALSSVDATESALRFYQFRFREAQALIDDAVARMSGQSGFAMAQWLPEGLWPANLANSTGAIDTALAVVEANLAESRRTRSAVAMALWMMMRSRVLLDQGQLDEARLQAETVVDLADDLALGDITQVTAGMVLLRVALHQGDRAALERRLEAAEGLAGNLAMHRAGAWMLALAALHDGDLDTANEQATDAWTTLEDPLPSMTNPPDFADDVELARMAIRGGHPERLARIVAVARLRAEENPGNALVAGILEHLEGLVGDSPARLGQAVELLRRTERPLLVAGALEDLGTALHQDLRAAGDGLDDSLPGSSSDAVAAWEEAAAVFDAAGAIRDAGRVRRSLREVGVIRRASTSAARDELSPRERQVVERLAAGSTTKQIASDLFLSPHTVVTHIRHVYAKWGVTSRKQLIERSRGLPEG